MQQKRSKTRSPKVAQTGHWRTLNGALDELGWPWLRLHDDLVAGQAFYRTYPPGIEINWEAISNRNRTLSLERSEVTFNGLAPGSADLRALTVAVEVYLPVGQRPPAASIKASWRDRVSEAEIKNAMDDIAKSYDGQPQRPSFPDVWSKLKDRWPGFPRDAARDALTSYAPQLKRRPGETSKIKSRS
jgi:hypothetical protein